MAQLSVARSRTEVLVNDFVRSVYNWMAIGLSVTGFVAFYVSTNMPIVSVISSPVIQIVLFLAVLGLVFAIGGMMDRISAGKANFLFFLANNINVNI